MMATTSSWLLVVVRTRFVKKVHGTVHRPGYFNPINEKLVCALWSNRWSFRLCLFWGLGSYIWTIIPYDRSRKTSMSFLSPV